MPIRWDVRNKRWRFEFNRVIAGRRHRASRLLPAGWSQAQADAFDRREAGRLYAVATGVERTDPLIDQAVTLYLTDKTSLKSYKATAEHLGAIAWAYAGRTMRDLPAVAKAVREEPAEPGRAPRSPATIRNRLACLKAACRWAWRQHGLTEHDPTARMQLPSVSNERQVYASRGQMLALCLATPARDVRILIRTAFYTGLRLGEIQRVEPGDGVLFLADTKNGDVRAIPVHPRIRCCLDYLPLGGKKRYYQHAFELAREAAGLQHLHIHDLRHSAASEMVNAGVDLFTVGQVLGHRDQRSTARYSHLNARTLADAVGKIGRKMRTTGQGAPRKKAA